MTKEENAEFIHNLAKKYNLTPEEILRVTGSVEIE
jgi:hypothetical protein